MNEETSSKPTDLLNSLTNEPDKDLNDLARAVIGAGIEVHRHLGPGLSEPLYESTFKLELNLHGIPFDSQVWVNVT